MVVGIVMLVGGFLMRPNQVLPPSPYPNPYPAPYPNPQPNPYNPTPQPPPFAAGVIEAFKSDGGTPDDAIVLASAFDQFASTLEYDGLQQAPRIGNGNDLGNTFARLQQYRFLQSSTSIGQKFPRLETFIATEMGRIGLKEGPLDSSKRSNAVLMFRTVANSLKGT